MSYELTWSSNATAVWTVENRDSDDIRYYLDHGKFPDGEVEYLTFPASRICCVLSHRSKDKDGNVQKWAEIEIDGPGTNFVCVLDCESVREKIADTAFANMFGLD